MMRIYESAEDYLERILMLTNKKGKIRSIDIVEDMNFSRASVSIAMKKLKENHFIDIDKDGYITLTQQGNQIAMSVYEKHQILTTFFQNIGVDEKTACEDACKIEHDLSNTTFTALKKFLEKVKNGE